MSEAIYDMEAYTQLTDDVILQIMRSDHPDLEESRHILDMVQRRQLYKCIGQTQPPDGTFIDRVGPRHHSSPRFMQADLVMSPLESDREIRLYKF